MSIDDFRKRVQVRQVAIPEEINVIPFGFNLFEINEAQAKKNVGGGPKSRRGLSRALRKLAPESQRAKLARMTANVKSFKSREVVNRRLEKSRSQRRSFSGLAVKSIHNLTKIKKTRLQI